MKDLVNNLTEEQVKELMYLLSRSGKVIIPEYYTTGSISTVLGQEPTYEQMRQVQENFEFDCDLQDIINEKVHLFLED